MGSQYKQKQCEFCGKDMPINYNQKPSVANQRRFCAQQCSVNFRHANWKALGKETPRGWKRLGPDGGKIVRSFIGERARTKYAANPKICKGCGASIPLPESGIPSDLRNKTHCSKSCSDAHRKRITFWGEDNLPPTLRLSTIPFKKKGEVKVQDLRQHAKKVYRSYSRECKCELCGIELPYLPEVAHIMPVAAWTNDALLLEINQLSNLIGLCPSDHKSFDLGHIPLGRIKEKVAIRRPRP